jgi:hypothetical protein
VFGKPKPHNDNRPSETRSVRRLRARLDESHQLHALTTDPLLGAVRAERFRASVTRCMWFFLAVGLGFTTTGVQAFLAGKLTTADPLWWGAWLVEPALAGILITLLRWEAEMLSAGLDVEHKAVKRLKHLLLAATLITNVWSSLRPATGAVNAGNVFLHVVIPAVVYLIAEVMPVITHRCNQARDKALAATPAPTATPAPAAPVTPVVEQPLPVPPVTAATPAPAPAAVVAPVRLRLPAPMLAALDAKTQAVRAQGRELTAQDVQDAVKVPPDYAARIVADLAA